MKTTKTEEIPEKRLSRAAITWIVIAVIIVIGIIGNAIGGGESNTSTQQESSAPTQVEEEQVIQEDTPKVKLQNAIVMLMNEGKAFDSGSYAAGRIPAGEYAFVPISTGSHYYSEDDASGNIIDNENFDSFGWVYVHGAGNLTTQGVLLKESDFSSLGISSVKELYTTLNDVSADYRQSGYYKVGVDIPAGSYTLTSMGSAYVSVEAGPIGNSSIIDNENFNGTYSVNVSNGQYLSLSRASY